MKTRLLASAVVATLSALNGCNVSDPPPFDPRLWQQPQRDAASDQPFSQMRPVPTTLSSEFLPRTEPATQPYVPTTGPALENDPQVRLSLAELIRSAIENSYDIKVAGYGPAIEGTRVTEAEARFDPTFFAAVSYEKRNQQTAGSVFFDPRIFQNVTTNYDQADILTFQTGVRQTLETGAQVELRYELSKTDLDPTRFAINPYYENDLVLQITQPLLRDFGTEVNRARIVINRNNQRITLLEFRRQIEETVAEIERTYWLLVAAQRNVQIVERLLDRSVATAQLLFKRQEQDVTRVQLSQANAEVEGNRATLIRARAQVRELSNNLKRLINDPRFPVTGQTLILPADEPLEEPILFIEEEQIETALDFRQELAQQQLRIDNADVTLKAAKNNLLPQLNLVGQIAGQAIDDSVSSAYEEWATNTRFGWSIGLQFEIPIGNRAARAIYRRSQLQRQQAIDAYKSLIDQVALDVKNSILEIHTSWDEVVARRQEVFAAADSLAALQAREDNQEPLTPEFVNLKLDAQRRLALAEQNAAQALAAYNIAITRLELSKGTLLRYNNILMEEEMPR
jgi:outer membrane protein